MTDQVTLHPIHSYLGCISINELNEATTLTNKDLNIYNLSKALKEPLELILNYVIKKTANENSRTIRVGKVIYRLHLIKRSGLVVLRWNAAAYMAGESLSNP